MSMFGVVKAFSLIRVSLITPMRRRRDLVQHVRPTIEDVEITVLHVASTHVIPTIAYDVTQLQKNLS